MEAGVHLPQLDFGNGITGSLLSRVVQVVDVARELGFVGVSANDHFVFDRPWADGLVLLGAAAEHAGPLDLMTSIALPTLRGVVPLAAQLRTLADLGEGRVVAGVGPGSSRADYDLVGVPWADRWALFDESLEALADLFRQAPDDAGRVRLWVASWGSQRGLRRVAQHRDGWVASAHHGTPDDFGVAMRRLAGLLRQPGNFSGTVDHALVTMWTWITDDPDDAEQVLTRVLAPALGRPPELLRGRVCVGRPEDCVAVLSRYAAQGCRRVYFWPVGEETVQLSRIAHDVLPQVSP